jgi:fluoride exporter
VIWLLVAIGGAIGSIARYALSTVVLRATGTLFPLGTFVVNAVGCLCFGVIVGAAEQRFTLTPQARAFLLVGILGGFTTFSSYVFESAALIRDGQMGAAVVNVAGQVVAGLAAFWIGAALGGLR